MRYMTLDRLFHERANNLNLIRLIAALSVIYGHATALTGRGPGDFVATWTGYKFIGGVAVDMFFVLSGFLITASALRATSWRAYASARLLRIYPALVMCVLLSVLVLGPAFTTLPLGDYLQKKETWTYLRLNATAWDTAYALPGVFEDHFNTAVNGSIWSLTVEIRLYLVTAILTALGLFKHRVVFNLAFAGVLISAVASPDVWAPLMRHENHRVVSLMFLIGAFYWVNRDWIPIHPLPMVLLMVLVTVSRHSPYFAWVYTLALPYLVFCLAFAPGLGWLRPKEDYSYGVYLYGWVCQQITVSLLPESTNLQHTAVASAAALACGMLSWHLIEKPCMKFRARTTAVKQVT
jgi:peptidoglycan/LPS O-acetylase OafA/YrhL